MSLAGGTQSAPTWVRLAWTGGGGPATGGMLAVGAAVWFGIAALLVVAIGTSLDEAVLAGQLLNGQTIYPEGHPHELYYRSVFSIWYRAMAVWLEVYPDPLFASFLRNVLFVGIGLVSAFVGGLVLTGRPRWGHVAAILTLAGAALPFAGTYPLTLFPRFYSDGHVGTHLAVIAVMLVVGKSRRAGPFLVGIFPVVHSALALVVWVFAGLFLLALPGAPVGAERRTFRRSALAGVLVSALLIVGAKLAAPDALHPPYDVFGEASVLRGHFFEFFDDHRQPIAARLGSPAYLVGPLLFFALLGLLDRCRSPGRGVEGGTVASLGVFGALSYGAVLVGSLCRGVPGWIGDTATMLMPGRFSNLGAVALVPLAAAVLGGREDALEPGERGTLGLVSVLALGATAVGGLLSASSMQDEALAATFAPALALSIVPLGGPPDRRGRWIAAAAALFTTLALRVGGRPGAALLFGAFLLACLAAPWVVRRVVGRVPGRAVPAAVALGTLLALGAVATLRTWRNRAPIERTAAIQWSRESAFDEELLRWLEANVDPTEPLMVPTMSGVGDTPWRWRLRHPTFFNLDTIWMMSYVPELAPTIAAMLADLYDIDMGDRAALEAISDDGFLRYETETWYPSWDARSPGRWREIGARWGLRYVLAPTHRPPMLPAVLEGADWSLFEIPGRRDAR